MPSASPHVTFSNGVKMPLVGLGTWQTDNEELAAIALENAIKAGYRMIDTATVYLNEALIGDVLQRLIKNGTVKREELFVVTKVWATVLHPKRQEASLRLSLSKLKLDYVDLVLAHMPTVLNEADSSHDTSVTVEEVWKGMEKLYDLGLAKSIGVSNWSVAQIERTLKIARIPIHNSQNEIHIYFPQLPLIECCKKHNISLTSYGSIGSPGRQIEFSNEGKKLLFEDSPNMMEEPEVKELSAKYKKTPAQILLKYLVQRDIAVIPKSSNPERIKQNIDLFDFNLTAAEIEKLHHVKHRQILFVQHFMIGHPEDGLVEFRKQFNHQPI